MENIRVTIGGKEIKGISSITYDSMQEFNKRVLNDWERQLKDYLIKNLKVVGFEFKDEAEFLEFCKNRLHRITTADKPTYFEFYVDKKIFVGAYDETVNIKYKENLVTAVIGKNFK